LELALAEHHRRRSGRKLADLPHAALIADVVGALLPIIDSPHLIDKSRAYRLSSKLWALLCLDDAMPGPAGEGGLALLLTDIAADEDQTGTIDQPFWAAGWPIQAVPGNRRDHPFPQ
jgi:hypothetical protein